MPDPVTVAALCDFLQTLSENTFPEEKLHFGSPQDGIKAILLTWMPSTAALEHAGRQGMNVVVSHESPFFHPRASEMELTTVQEVHAWPPNAARIAMAEKYNLNLVQCHRSLDAWGVGRFWAKDVLGLGDPVVAKGIGDYQYTQIYEVEPTPAIQLVQRFKKTLGLDRIRIHLKDPDRLIRRIGNAWGGIGLSNNSYYAALILAEEVDMVLGGEMDEAAAYFYAESGVDVIELGHNRSESPGVAQLAPLLQQKMGVPVEVYPDETPLVIM